MPLDKCQKDVLMQLRDQRIAKLIKGVQENPNNYENRQSLLEVWLSADTAEKIVNHGDAAIRGWARYLLARANTPYVEEKLDAVSINQ